MNGSRVHHIGYVTASIADCVESYEKATGLVWNKRIIHDPLQMVSVAFLSAGDGDTAMIELVEPAGPRSPVRKFLESGGGLHHICVEVADLQAHIDSSVKAGCTLVRVPLPAAAFAGRKIAWITTAAGQLIELLQRA